MHSADKLSGATETEQRGALSLRNRLLTLLADRVQSVRRAARYLYRSHPKELRKFTRAYERTRRRARARAKATEPQAASDVPPEAVTAAS